MFCGATTQPMKTTRAVKTMICVCVCGGVGEGDIFVSEREVVCVRERARSQRKVVG